MKDERKPIGYVIATVEFPLYEGDKTEREYGWNDFIYEEPGITPKGDLGVCRRPCKTIKAVTVSADEHDAAGERSKGE